MRWVHLSVIILFAAATFLFAVQNLGIVTVSFLGFSDADNPASACRIAQRTRVARSTRRVISAFRKP
jgi:uncharacterized integral membrane protein